jgi:hypothetical protein
MVRIEHAEGFNLVAVKFSRPLTNSNVPRKAPRRKLAASV